MYADNNMIINMMLYNMRMNNMINNNNLNNDSNIKTKGINLYFRRNDSSDRRVFLVQATLDERIQDIIQRYRNISGDNREDIKFIYDAKQLNIYLTADEVELIIFQ